MQLDVLKQFLTRSERVKGIDFHPLEPWVLTTLYNGKVEIWSYATNTLVKSIQVSEMPVRAGKFIARKNWMVVGADDFHLRVYNYNTGEKVAQFEAHPDYIRSIAVHPSKPYVLTSSDDLTVRMWNWETGWKLEQTFEGHQHFVMSVCFNPKDPNTFALASLDRTVKIWLLGLAQPNFTLVAHDAKGVNYVDYYPQADKPYLITTSDDKTIKVWDYQTKSCVATLEGHLLNVLFAIFHPELPVIVSGSEDGTVRFWNSTTFKLEKSVNYSLERVWCIGILAKSNLVAVGCDTGYVLLKLGNEEPLFSMDANAKLVYARNSDVYQSVVKPAASEGVKDGEVVPLQLRELGLIEIFPQLLAHSPNGRYAAVCGDGEYIIYTALAWRSKTYGKALDFCWNSHDLSNATAFAVRESPLLVKIFRNLQEHLALDLVYQADKLFAGALLGVKLEGCISFYDWDSGHLARRVDIDDDITAVVWLDNGELVAIVTSSGSGGDKAASAKNDTYFLTYNHDNFERAVAENTLDPEEGAEDAFDVWYTLPTSEPVLLGRFVGDVFVYTTATTNRLNYFVGGEVINVGHFDHKYFIVGYRTGENKLYLIDKSFNVVSWFLNADVLELQTLVMRGDLEQLAPTTVNEDGEEVPDLASVHEGQLPEDYANLLSGFSKTELNQLSRFFEKLGYLSLSYSLSQDFDSKFLILVASQNLTQAYSLLSKYEEENPTTKLANSAKWKKLGDLALASWNIKLAQDCYTAASDYASLLLLVSSSNNTAALKELAKDSEAKGRYNIAWQARWLTGDKDACVDLLVKSERFPEAAFLGVNYGGDRAKVDEAVDKWRNMLKTSGREKVAQRLLGPDGAPSATLIDLEENGENGERKEAATKVQNEEQQSVKEDLETLKANGGAEEAEPLNEKVTKAKEVGEVESTETGVDEEEAELEE